MNWFYLFLTSGFILQERKFQESLNEKMEMSLKRLVDTHREKVALLEKQFLQQKQQLLRGNSNLLFYIDCQIESLYFNSVNWCEIVVLVDYYRCVFCTTCL